MSATEIIAYGLFYATYGIAFLLLLSIFGYWAFYQLKFWLWYWFMNEHRNREIYWRRIQYHSLKVREAPFLLPAIDHAEVEVTCVDCDLKEIFCHPEEMRSRTTSRLSWENFASGEPRGMIGNACPKGIPGHFAPPDLSAIQGTPWAKIPIE